MKSPNTDISKNLQQFAQRYIDGYQDKYHALPCVEHDSDWPSPCLQAKKDQQLDYWQPVSADDDLCFDNIEQALELTLHSDYKVYFTSLYSESLPAKCEHGGLELLFAWSKGDFERLQENIIGHVVMKRRLKQKVSLFFAVTDEEDCILSIDNETGEVFVEQVGCEPTKKLAASLSEFITLLEPIIK